MEACWILPDVIFLIFFSQDVIGCLCINPGRLTKGQVGGTFGRLVVQRRGPDAEGKRRSPCLTGQVVKIWNWKVSIKTVHL